jgi:hypothetical protein
MVLEARLSAGAEHFLDGLMALPSLRSVDFDHRMSGCGGSEVRVDEVVPLEGERQAPDLGHGVSHAVTSSTA